MKHNHVSQHGFTLVELMVAMAVLIIMMGFLFQFVLGAQRIWSASEDKNSVFQTANVVLDVIENDLHNMQFSTEPGRTLPFYARHDGNDWHFAFFTNSPSKNFTSSVAKSLENVGTYPVYYYYDSTANRLYRIYLDSATQFDANGTSRTITNLWYLYGSNVTDENTASDFFTAFATSILGIDTSGTHTLDTMKNLEPYLVADNITSFQMDIALFSREDGKSQTFNPSAANTATTHYRWYADARPRLVRVQMTIEPPTDETRPGEANANQFAQIITLY